MTAIAIIPARGGSQRIPGKNWKEFHGKPIIQYSIETATRSGLFDQIVVTTDHQEIADAAHAAGAFVVWRPAGLAKNEVGTQDVASATLALFKRWPEWACCIYPTAPMMTIADLRQGITLLKNSGNYNDYAMAVGTEPLRDAGQWYWGRAEAFASRRSLIGPRTLMIPIEESRVCDINTPEDWAKAEKMYEAFHSVRADQLYENLLTHRPSRLGDVKPISGDVLEGAK